MGRETPSYRSPRDPGPGKPQQRESITLNGQKPKDR